MKPIWSGSAPAAAATQITSGQHQDTNKKTLIRNRRKTTDTQDGFNEEHAQDGQDAKRIFLLKTNQVLRLKYRGHHHPSLI
jgi:hypothetical protein